MQTVSDLENEEIVWPVEKTGLKPGQALNVVQKLVIPYLETDCNLIVSSGTNTGKSNIVCMLAHQYLYGKKKKKVVYVAPMKALVEEKRRDWADPQHPFSQFRSCVISGDFVNLGADEQASESDIITITPESLASRIRNNGNIHCWLDEVGLLAIDEAHLLGDGERGATLEAMLIEFTYRNPDVQILMLSGTMKNREQFTGWANTLNSKETHLIHTDWRPVPLHKHFLHVNATSGDAKKQEVTEAVIRILQQYPDDQFMIAVFNKVFGRTLEAEITRKLKKTAEFHNADKDRANRTDIENRFRAKKLQYMIATSTVFAGMNLPVRRIILTDCLAGLKEISSSTLNQAAGRAGRFGLDPEGDAYFLLPVRVKDLQYHIDRIKEGEVIKSQLNSAPAIAQHFLGAVYLGRIQTHPDFYDWYSRTFKHYQDPLVDERKQKILDRIIEDMDAKNMLVDREGKLVLKRLGAISTQMAVDPYYLHSLNVNFNKLFSFAYIDDIALAKAFSDCSKFVIPYMSDYTKAAIHPDIRTKIAPEIQAKASVVYSMLKGEDVPSILHSHKFETLQDIERICFTLSRVSEEVQKWGKKTEIMSFMHRIRSNAEPDIAWLMAQGANKRQARQLLKIGVTDLKKVKDNPELAKEVSKIL